MSDAQSDTEHLASMQKAMSKIIGTLTPMPTVQRLRVIRMVETFFGLDEKPPVKRADQPNEDGDQSAAGD